MGRNEFDWKGFTMFGTSRRSFLREAAVASAAVGTMGAASEWLASPAQASLTASGNIGVVGGNNPASYLQFAKFLGKKPPLALLAFNQSNADALWSSVPYICGQGAAFMASGAQVLWSVPCPGSKQLENIVNRNWIGKYGTIFKSILAVSPQDSSSILVRLPWEFNLSSQENAAIDQNGKFNAALFVAAWRILSSIAKGVSPRFKTVWCPNVTTMQLDPATCWPGASYVDIISQDFYMQAAYNKPGDFSWFLNEQRGLLWAAQFAKANGKPYGLSEWGMDSDAFVGDFNATSLWLKGLGASLQHHCWWDETAVINCEISNNAHPGLAAAYKAQWA